MPDYRKYLLRTNAAVKDFEQKNAERIHRNAGSWIKWVNSLEEMRWVEFVRPEASEEDIEFIVGLLCILYIHKKINISFHDNTADSIERMPW